MTVTEVEPARDDRASVDKAMSLLAAFGDRGSAGLGVSELARRARMSKSTAFRVLGMLERNGLVERAGTGYRLGARLHELGRSVYPSDHDHTRDLLLPFVTDLYEVTRQTVHLGVLHGTDVVYLAKLYGHRQVPAPSRIGGRLPAHCTAVGKVLLAYDPEAALLALSSPLSRFTPRTIVDPAELAVELDKIRRDGLAFDDEESRLGLSCVAAPVRGQGGRVVAALSVASPRGRLDVGRCSADLRRLAAAASQRLVRGKLAHAG